MNVVNFVDIRDTAIDQIKAAFLENKKLYIAAHPGRFNEAEIKRLANRTRDTHLVPELYGRGARRPSGKLGVIPRRQQGPPVRRRVTNCFRNHTGYHNH